MAHPGGDTLVYVIDRLGRIEPSKVLYPRWTPLHPGTSRRQRGVKVVLIKGLPRHELCYIIKYDCTRNAVRKEAIMLWSYRLRYPSDEIEAPDSCRTISRQQVAVVYVHTPFRT